MPFLRIKTRSSSFIPASEPATKPTCLSDVMATGLADAGFDHCFGIPGRHVQDLFRSLADVGMRPVLTRHEQGAVYMADGYARVAGKPGLVVGTAGPGASNMVTGVANAFADGVPVLCVTGAAPRHIGSRGAFQELGDDHTNVTPAIFAPITRYNAQLSHPSQWGPVLRLSLTGLQQGGPVNVSIPADMFEAPARPVEAPTRFKTAPLPDLADVEEAARLLMAHPDALILAGRGALGAHAQLKALAERLQIPVITTVHGRGVIDEDHPLALGPQGFGASCWAERYIAEHAPSLVIAIGTSLREISTTVYHPAFAGGEGLIHVTRDAQAIGRHYATRLGVVADAEAFVGALLPLVGDRPANQAVAAFKAATPRFDAVGLEDRPGAVSPRRVVETVRELLDGDADMLFVDTGNAIPWTVRYFPVHRPGTYFASAHLAAMGWGTAAAVGGALARPEARTVAIVGDGCFQMAGMEVATAVQHEVPVVWIVLNDARLNMVYQGSKHYYGKEIPATELAAIDCAKIGEGLGALSWRVEDPAELAPAIAAALASGRPAVVDVAIAPDLMPPMGGRGEALRRFERERG